MSYDYNHVFVDNLNASQVKELVEYVRKWLEKYGCSKPSSVTWKHLERLMNDAVNLRFERKPMDMTSGLSAFLNSWKFDKQLHEKVEGALNLLPHRFVPFAEFEISMGLLFNKFVKQILVENKTCKRFILLMQWGKSNVWIFLCFLAFCREKVPDAYMVLKSKLRIYTNKDVWTGKQCVLYKRDSCLLWMDDVAYSGYQMELEIKKVTTVTDSRMIAGFVYASQAALQRIRRLASSYNTKVSVLKSGNIESLSSQHLKWLNDNDVKFFSQKGDFMNSLFGVLGAWAPCRTVFEHKIADEVSVPKYMSLPLEEASPVVLQNMDVVSYELKGVKHKLRSFSSTAKQKIVSRGWLYGDFCEDNAWFTCFTPQYQKLA